MSLKSSKWWWQSAFVVFLAVLNIFLIGFLYQAHHEIFPSPQAVAAPCEENPEDRFGFSRKEYMADERQIRPNQFMSDILSKGGLTAEEAFRVSQRLGEKIDLKAIRPGTNYAFISPDLCARAHFFAMDISPLTYLTCDILGDCTVRIHHKKTDTLEFTKTGIINSSLWNALTEQDIPLYVMDQMDDALSSNVDFYNAQEGDIYKLCYRDIRVDGKSSGIYQLIAAQYRNQSGLSKAYYFEHPEKTGYFDERGRPSRKFFLRAPP